MSAHCYTHGTYGHGHLTISPAPDIYSNLSVTLAAWFKVDGSFPTTAYMGIVDLSNGSDTDTLLETLPAQNNDNDVEFWVTPYGGGSCVYDTVTDWATDSTWCWVALALTRHDTASVKDGYWWKSGLSGIQTGALGTGGAITKGAPTTHTFWVGSDPWGEIFTGWIACARLWTARLSSAELALEMKSSRAVRSSNLWGDWPLVKDANDISGNGRTLSWINFPSGEYNLTDNPPVFSAPPFRSSPNRIWTKR